MRWFVVQTQPRSEERAVLNLARLGFETYLPRFLKRRRHARKVEIVSTPLFPRYLFVTEKSALHRWRSIRSTFGVSQLVVNGEQPALLSGSLVDALKVRERNGVIELPRRTYEPGTKVLIKEGAFENCCGLFEEMRDDERVCVLLDLLGRKVRVVLDELALAPA